MDELNQHKQPALPPSRKTHQVLIYLNSEGSQEGGVGTLTKSLTLLHAYGEACSCGWWVVVVSCSNKVQSRPHVPTRAADRAPQ